MCVSVCVCVSQRFVCPVTTKQSRHHAFPRLSSPALAEKDWLCLLLLSALLPVYLVSDLFCYLFLVLGPSDLLDLWFEQTSAPLAGRAGQGVDGTQEGKGESSWQRETHSETPRDLRESLMV